MTKVFKRVLEKKKEVGYTWEELSNLAKIPLASWMTGIPTMTPTDSELKALALVLNTTFEYLKYGK